MASLGEKVIGVLKARNFNVSVLSENAAVSGGLLVGPNKNPKVICADTRVNFDDETYTGNVKLIGGLHILPAVKFGGTRQGYKDAANLLASHGVQPAIHVGNGEDPHDCKMYKLWIHDRLQGVYRLDMSEIQLAGVLQEFGVMTERLEGHGPRDLIVNTIDASTINKAAAPRSLAADQWFAEKLGIGDGHLDILAQAGEYLFGENVAVKVIVDSKLARR